MMMIVGFVLRGRRVHLGVGGVWCEPRGNW